MTNSLFEEKRSEGCNEVNSGNIEKHHGLPICHKSKYLKKEKQAGTPQMVSTYSTEENLVGDEI